MEKKNLKKYKIDGNEMQFNSVYFKHLYHTKRKSVKGLTGEQIKEELGTVTGSTSSTVHTWLYGSSAPSDEYKIYDIAEYFGVDYRKLLVDVISNDNQGGTKMNNTTAIKTKEAKDLPKYETYSYFTKAAIMRAYDMITEFIHEADIDNFYCFIELAVKIKKMRGIIPYDLHDKLMNFVLTEVKEMMIDIVPNLDVDDIEDEDVELANAVYETPYTILKNLHTFAEKEMEPYIGSKSETVKSHIEKAKVQETIEAIKKYKKLTDEEITKEKISSYLEKGQLIFKVCIDDNQNHIKEITTYGCDYGRQSYITMGTDEDINMKSSIEYTMVPFYNFKAEEPNSWSAPIDINEDDSNVVETSFAITNICRYAIEGSCESDSHFEFYISKGFGNFASAGGPLELEFVESWMIDKGYFVP